MPSKAEDPTGDLPSLFLVFEPCKLDDGNMFSAGQFVVLPLGLRPADISEAEPFDVNLFARRVEYIMNYAATVIGRGSSEVGPNRESLAILPTDIFEDAWC